MAVTGSHHTPAHPESEFFELLIKMIRTTFNSSHIEHYPDFRFISLDRFSCLDSSHMPGWG